MNKKYMSKWTIDKMHSEVGFKVKHLMISTVKGNFSNFEGSVVLPEDNFEKAEISFSAEAATVNTNNQMRDEHLKSADFFDASSFPLISFKSKSVKNKNDNNYVVVGDLTMRGVTKEVIFEAVFNGKMVDMYGGNVMAFEINGSLNRKDFGLNWNASLEKGGVVVSEEIKFDINLELKEEKES
ncbi:MAG: YceI family protein [Burkholderiales bacterium]|nr:YceI family protein [Burkholderiales bacterium]